MQGQVTALTAVQSDAGPPVDHVAAARVACREATLRRALQKRKAGVPTYSVPEAAALLSVSSEHLYRLVKAGAFPAARLRVGGEQGRYVVPARVVELLLDSVMEGGGCVEVAEWSQGEHGNLCHQITAGPAGPVGSPGRADSATGNLGEAAR